MSLIRTLSLKTALIAASLVLGLGLVEGGARLLLGPPLPAEGVLFYSRFPYGAADTAAVRFAPGATVRAIGYYGAHKEFDVAFATNNLGFIDPADYPLPGAARNVAVVGDSFAAGYYGGAPWIPELRSRIEGANVYNFGVTGAGFENFAELLADAFAAVRFDEIVIAAISSDVPRPSWRPLARDGKLYHCIRRADPADCTARISPIFLLDGPAGESDVPRLVEGYYRALQGKGFWRSLAKDTHVGRMLRIRAWRERKKPLDRIEVPDFTRGALEKIRRDFPALPIAVFHIPEKREVLAGHYAADLRAPAEATGMRFVDGLKDCGLEAADFFPRDSHPNARGNAKLLECAAKALK